MVTKLLDLTLKFISNFDKVFEIEASSSSNFLEALQISCNTWVTNH